MRGTVLLVDDEAYVRDSLAQVFQRKDFMVRTAEGAEEALRGEVYEGVDAAVVDLRMPDGDGLSVLRALKEREPQLPVIILTGHGSVVNAVECLKAGAFDFVQKPADPQELVLLVERAIEDASMRRELSYLRDRDVEASSNVRAVDPPRTSGTSVVVAPGTAQPGGGGVGDAPLGVSQAWVEVMRLAATVASSDASVLLLGESGVGKEVVARFIHRHSARAERPFVAVNCASVPPDLFESEFFGHRKGSFTGAHADRDGRFRVAHEGTLFLDEIGCMPEASQTKVLRVLQDGVFERIGETRPTTVDVRVIAATNAKLESAIEAGSFREDLYYRVAVVVIAIPPLRERPEDVRVLAEHFLYEIATRHGKIIESISEDALAVLRAYEWPGNVRELRNVVEHAVLFESTQELGVDALPSNVRSDPTTAPRPAVGGASADDGDAGHRDATGVSSAFGGGGKRDVRPGEVPDGAPAEVPSGGEVPATVFQPVDRLSKLELRETLLQAEREIIEEALRRANGVRREAARLLAVDERNLSYFLRKHGLGRARDEDRS